MADLLFMVITIAFFAVCVAYVRLCDRIIGPDPAPTASAPVVEAEHEAVSVIFANQAVDNYVGLAVAVAVLMLLVLVLVFPERF